jgi:predicted transcriptional regulator YheO
MPVANTLAHERGQSIDDYIDLLRPIVEGIAATFGSRCEAVLHDYRDPEHSIMAVAGDVTHRHIGGSVTQMGLTLLAQGDAAQHQLNYLTRTPDGRVLKSSTIVLRNPSGQVIGALCINVDVTDLRLMAHALEELAGAEETPKAVTFADDVSEVIRAVVDEEEIALGRPIDRMNKADRLAIFRRLEERGVFALQRSVSIVADQLRISRATAYNYLEAIRPEREATGAEPTGNGRGADATRHRRSGAALSRGDPRDAR